MVHTVYPLMNLFLLIFILKFLFKAFVFKDQDEKTQTLLSVILGIFIANTYASSIDILLTLLYVLIVFSSMQFTSTKGEKPSAFGNAIRSGFTFLTIDTIFAFIMPAVYSFIGQPMGTPPLISNNGIFGTDAWKLFFIRWCVGAVPGLIGLVGKKVLDKKLKDPKKEEERKEEEKNLTEFDVTHRGSPLLKLFLYISGRKEFKLSEDEFKSLLSYRKERGKEIILKGEDRETRLYNFFNQIYDTKPLAKIQAGLNDEAKSIAKSYTLAEKNQKKTQQKLEKKEKKEAPPNIKVEEKEGET